MGGVNFMLHAAGWMEGGLVSSYEKFVMDCDQLGMMHSFAKGIDISTEAQALDAIAEVGPGGHFLGCEHTQNNFKTAFYRSEVADNGSFEQWEMEGSRDTATRANALWKKTLAEYEAPALDPGIDEALCAFIREKKAAVPDSFT
jgi:trimethylamine--corrinoid protein Co-methyltransferase